MRLPQEVWLRCRVSPGMFDSEIGVQGQQFDGSEYSLFAPAHAGAPAALPMVSGETVPGFVKVKALQQQGNLVLVELPGQTFQNGSFITVTKEQLEMRPPS